MKSTPVTNGLRDVKANPRVLNCRGRGSQVGGSTFSSAGPGKPRELDLFRTTRAETYKAVHWVASQPDRQPRWQPCGDMTCVNEPGQLNIREQTGLTLASLFPKKYGSQESLTGAQQARWEGARHLCRRGRAWLAGFEGNMGRSDVLRGPQGCERHIPRFAPDHISLNILSQH